jgi:hypothetical protein
MPQRYNPPPGWPVPSGGWRPSFDWKPDPSWPPAPPGWVFWVKEAPVSEPVAAWKLSRKYVGAVVAVGLVGVGALTVGLGADEFHGGSHSGIAASPDWWGSGPVLGPLPDPKPAHKGTVEIKASLVGLKIDSKSSAAGPSVGGSGASAGSSSRAAAGNGKTATGNRAGRRAAARGPAAHRSDQGWSGWPSGFGRESAQGYQAAPETPRQHSRHRATGAESFSWFGTSTAAHQTVAHPSTGRHAAARHRAEGHTSSHAHLHGSLHGSHHGRHR